jgi:Phage terminase large subunit
MIDLQTPSCFEPLSQPSRYKASHGGRGSGKSWHFASMVVERCLLNPGSRIVCIREVQKTLNQSAKALIERTIQQLGVGHMFRVKFESIETPGGGLIIFNGMQDQNAESIKSLEGYDVAWVEEAQTLSARSLQLLRPTIRAENSELWFTWNPRRKVDPVDELFRGGQPPENAIVVKANWRDNPWFPSVLEEERQFDLQRYPDRYHHVWEGDYARAFEGAYFDHASCGSPSARPHWQRWQPIRSCRAEPSGISAAPAPRPTRARSGSCSGFTKRSACSTTSKVKVRCLHTTRKLCTSGATTRSSARSRMTASTPRRSLD